jgi:uncharacterized coiled-coil protein SlyX
LTSIELGEVSVVDAPANSGARHLMFKNTAAIGDGQPAEDADPEQDADQAAVVADLRRQIAEAQTAHAANQAALAVVTEQLLAAPPAPPEPAASQPPPAPVPTPWERADTELAALAIIARETPEKASRTFWRQQVDLLGRHLGPDRSATEQVALALDDERGHAFVEALQSRPA